MWLLFALAIIPRTFEAPQRSSNKSNDGDKGTKVDLQIIKFADFEKALKASKGKIVVVYLWGDYSAPDRLWLKRVVEMRRRLPKKPVKFITICHSPVAPHNPKELEKKRLQNLRFLKEMKADFQNFLFGDDDEILNAKLHFVSGPTFVVYDRHGKDVKFYDLATAVYRFMDIEKFLKKLLADEAK